MYVCVKEYIYILNTYLYKSYIIIEKYIIWKLKVHSSEDWQRDALVLLGLLHEADNS